MTVYRRNIKLLSIEAIIIWESYKAGYINIGIQKATSKGCVVKIASSLAKTHSRHYQAVLHLMA